MKGSKQADGTIEGSRTHKTGMFLEHNQICPTQCNQRLNSLMHSHLILTKCNLVGKKLALKDKTKHASTTIAQGKALYDGYHVI